NKIKRWLDHSPFPAGYGLSMIIVSVVFTSPVFVFMLPTEVIRESLNDILVESIIVDFKADLFFVISMKATSSFIGGTSTILNGLKLLSRSICGLLLRCISVCLRFLVFTDGSQFSLLTTRSLSSSH
ncbi:hypothetical protein PENTCL1PPCAC_20275, partial [Pristionchus entomophagus]